MFLATRGVGIEHLPGEFDVTEDGRDLERDRQDHQSRTHRAQERQRVTRSTELGRRQILKDEDRRKPRLKMRRISRGRTSRFFGAASVMVSSGTQPTKPTPRSRILFKECARSWFCPRITRFSTSELIAYPDTISTDGAGVSRAGRRRRQSRRYGEARFHAVGAELGGIDVLERTAKMDSVGPIARAFPGGSSVATTTSLRSTATSPTTRASYPSF